VWYFALIPFPMLELLDTGIGINTEIKKGVSNWYPGSSTSLMSIMKLNFCEGHDNPHWAGVGERGLWRSFGIMKNQKKK
jgi:hypothetical protein